MCIDMPAKKKKNRQRSEKKTNNICSKNNLLENMNTNSSK